MKILRILTGIHAGAQLRLSPGRHRIGYDDDSDIRISDWTGKDLLLIVDEEGIITAQRIEDIPGAQDVIDPGTVFLIDFAPMRFDDTAICVGWEDAVWPSDLDLLSTLLIKPIEALPKSEIRQRRKLLGIGLGCSMLAVLIVISSMLMTTQTSSAAAPHSDSNLAQHIDQMLHAANQPELHSQALGSMVKISGMVATSTDDAAVRNILGHLGTTTILRQYDVASNDARSIEESLGINGIHVAYAGHGVFNVVGQVLDIATSNVAIARVRRDLDENVKDLRTQVTEIGKPGNAAPSFSELVSSDAVRYAETTDGVKHIYTSATTSTAQDNSNDNSASPSGSTIPVAVAEGLPAVVTPAQ